MKAPESVPDKVAAHRYAVGVGFSVESSTPERLIELYKQVKAYFDKETGYNEEKESQKQRYR